MSAHTPGPWTLETVPTSIGSCHKVGPFPGGYSRPESYACIYADGIRIGVDESLPRAIELAANARLIAAAPDLLDALTRLVNESTHHDGAEFEDGEWCALDIARAVLAKAGAA